MLLYSYISSGIVFIDDQRILCHKQEIILLLMASNENKHVGKLCKQLAVSSMNPASATGSVQLSVQTKSLFKPSHYHSILPLQCSTTCGKGQRVRQVHCVSKGIEVDDSECPGEKPVTIKGCRRERCAKNRNENQNVPDNNRAKVGDYSWKKGKWSDVSKAMNHFIIDTICMSISQF